MFTSFTLNQADWLTVTGVPEFDFAFTLIACLGMVLFPVAACLRLLRIW